MSNAAERRWVTCLVRCCLGTALVLCGVQATDADSADDGTGDGAQAAANERVRSPSPTLKRLIADGNARSATFHSLIMRISATDGLVYVLEGKCPDIIRSCLLLDLRRAGTHRVLRIHVETGGRRAEELIGSIGHELQHAFEVLDDPRVVSPDDMIGVWLHGLQFSNQRFETNEAIEIGIRVRQEVADAGYR